MQTMILCGGLATMLGIWWTHCLRLATESAKRGRVMEIILALGHLHDLLYEHVGVYREGMPDSIFKTEFVYES